MRNGTSSEHVDASVRVQGFGLRKLGEPLRLQSRSQNSVPASRGARRGR